LNSFSWATVVVSEMHVCVFGYVHAYIYANIYICVYIKVVLEAGRTLDQICFLEDLVEPFLSGYCRCLRNAYMCICMRVYI